MDRLDYFGGLARESPTEPRARYAYAHELVRAERWEAAVVELRAYLELSPDDEGAAHGRLGLALARLGRTDEAADAYLAGVDAALAHGHQSMADEFAQALEEL